MPEYTVGGTFEVRVDVDEDLDELFEKDEDRYYQRVDEILKEVSNGEHDLSGLDLVPNDLW